MATLYEAEARCSLGRSAGDRASSYQPFLAAHFPLRWLQRKKKSVFPPICLMELKAHSRILRIRNATESYGFYVKFLTPVIQKASLLLSEFRQLQETQMQNTRSGQWIGGVSAIFMPLLYSCMQCFANEGIYNTEDMYPLKKNKIKYIFLNTSSVEVRQKG